MKVRVIDSHTGGEPTRVVVAGFPDLLGDSLPEKVADFRHRYDHLRRGIILEPRGSDIWVGALLMPGPSVIFFNSDGYLGMCGHGTIGLVETLHHLDAATSPSVELQTPVGPVTAHRHPSGEVTLTNVAAYMHQADVTVVTEHGTFTGDVAYGGNWFFLIYDQPFALTVANQEQLMAVTKAIRGQLARDGITGPHGEVIDHVELFGPSEVGHSRNFVLCPGNAYDRSPCGTGTSAKLAALFHRGSLREGEEYVQESITGSVFRGTIHQHKGELIPTISGRAFITAESELIFNENDPLRWGIPS